MNRTSLPRHPGWWAPAVAAVCLVALSGCGEPIGPDGAPGPGGGAASSGATASAPSSSATLPPGPWAKVEEAKYVTTKSGLKYAILKPGVGTAAKSGDLVSMHYTGWLKSNGEKFDSSRDKGEPFPFPLGRHQVIDGWDEGVAGMKPGEQRQLVIPSDLGYGESGQGPIPAGATLVFDVELVRIGE